MRHGVARRSMIREAHQTPEGMRACTSHPPPMSSVRVCGSGRSCRTAPFRRPPRRPRPPLRGSVGLRGAMAFHGGLVGSGRGGVAVGDGWAGGVMGSGNSPKIGKPLARQSAYHNLSAELEAPLGRPLFRSRLRVPVPASAHRTVSTRVNVRAYACNRT